MIEKPDPAWLRFLKVRAAAEAIIAGWDPETETRQEWLDNGASGTRKRST